jgi:hypothetical protein
MGKNASGEDLYSAYTLMLVSFFPSMAVALVSDSFCLHPGWVLHQSAGKQTSATSLDDSWALSRCLYPMPPVSQVMRVQGLGCA